MSTVLSRPREIESDIGERPKLDAPVPPPDAIIGSRPSSLGLAALLGAYRHSGGTARGVDLSRLLAHRQRGDCVSLARHIALGDVFGFEWREAPWIPMFQFDTLDQATYRGVRAVLGEMRAEADGWALAAWFANANPHLRGQRPVDLLRHDLPAVLLAARAT